MSREMCYRCYWPKKLCWCSSILPQETETRFVFLMHPMEFKRIKAGTGRFTHLSLSNSEIHVGIGFDENAAVQKLLRDPAYLPVLLYPGKDAFNLSNAASLPFSLEGKSLLVFLLDATWACAKKMLTLNPSLMSLPRISFNPELRSRYVIKKQPREYCLSTLEAVHELLLILERLGADSYPHPERMLHLFKRMQDFQLRCAEDPPTPTHRVRPLP